MGARLSTSPLPALADPGRSQPLPPRGAPRGTSPPLRSSQPPVSRKLTPRASSRAARWGCRLRDLHGLGLRKDQHACELFTFGLRVCVGLLCRPRGPEDRLDSWLRWAPGLPAERRSAPRMARLFRAWRTCWDLPERRGEPGPARAWNWKPGAALGCGLELLVGRELLPAYLTQPSWVSLARDLLHPSLDEEKKKHKKKRLVQSPNSYFMDVKCCYKITTVFSHAQTVVLCVGCSTVLCQPTGGKARLTEGCSFRRKQH
uniref:40S ribosomal protein S27 n=1 Tax=Bos mutus grunniens TaxID=30521 RepID=A0A8C0A473_BOSMU